MQHFWSKWQNNESFEVPIPASLFTISLLTCVSLLLLQVRRRRGPGPPRALEPAARGCATSRRNHPRSVGQLLPTPEPQTLTPHTSCYCCCCLLCLAVCSFTVCLSGLKRSQVFHPVQIEPFLSSQLNHLRSMGDTVWVAKIPGLDFLWA